MGRTKQTVSLTEFAVFQRAFAALSEKVVSQETQIESLTTELSTLKALFEDFQKVPGDDETTQCYSDGVADLNDFEDDGIPMGIPQDDEDDGIPMGIPQDDEDDGIPMGIPQDDEDDGIPMGIPQDDEVKKVKKVKRVKKVLSPEVILLKASYKTLYGSGPRGRSCNSETWLRKKIAQKEGGKAQEEEQKEEQMRPVDGSGFLCSPCM
jgi:hypothetical protein